MNPLRTITTTFITVLVSVAITSLAVASDLGTAEEAHAMLDRAATAINDDRDQAINDFNAGVEGFKDRDLYVFCADDMGELVAHGANQDLLGSSILDFTDKNGNPFLGQIFGLVIEGEVAEIDYAWPRPGETELAQKISLVTKAQDLICGVGYYK